MKDYTLKAFEYVLVLFALSVCLTMYSMAAGEDEEQLLWGLNYSYFLLPLLVVNVLICLAYFNSLNLIGLNKWIALWGIIATLSALVISRNSLTTFIRVNMWTTSYFAAYIIARRNPNAIRNIIECFVVIFIMGFIFFWQGKIVQSSVMKHGLETRSNAIYCLITIVPIIMLVRRKWLSLVLIIMTFVSTIFSSKRGATIILMITLIPTIRNVFPGAKTKGMKNIILVILILALAYVLFYVSETMLGGVLSERFSNIDEDEGGGRTLIWTYIIARFADSSFIEQLFGHGYYSVGSIIGATAAHNDFIQVLYDYGYMGFLVYSLIHIYMIARVLKLHRNRNPYFLPYVVMYSIFFIMSMVSILIVQQRYLIYMAIFWGLLEGCNYNYNIIKAK